MFANPKVSVCMPVYNGELYLAQAIQSVLNQSFEDYELNIVDDHSKDHTVEIARSFTDKRIKVIINEQNQGLVGNWNRCISLANGELITIFHADDVMQPNHLQKEVEKLSGDGKIGLVHTNIRRINPRNEIIGDHWVPVSHNDTIEESSFAFERFFHEGNYICCPAVMTRTACYQKLGGFNPNLHHTADMEMWMRIALNYDVVFIAEPTIHYRIHTAQDLAKYYGSGQEVKEVEQAFKITLRENKDRIVDIKLFRYKYLKHLANWSMFLAKQGFWDKKIRASINYLGLFVSYMIRMKMSDANGGRYTN